MPNEIAGDQSAPDSRVAIVVAQFNRSITSKLLAGAIKTLTEAGVADDDIDVAWVPGAWEIPLITQVMCRRPYAGIICLGAVIKGGTTHDEHINRAVSLALMQIGVDSGLPVAFGLLTCNTLEQAIHRSGGAVGNKGHEAAEAILELLRLGEKIKAGL